MNEIMKSMILQIRDKLRKNRLKEGRVNFDVASVVDQYSLKKWANRSAEDVIKAAKKKDKTALEFLFVQMGGTIYNVFDKNFMGSNSQIKSYRINNENAWDDWLEIAWFVLVEGFDEFNEGYNTSWEAELEGKTRADTVSVIDAFKIEQNKGNLYGAFAKLYASKLFNAARNSNVTKMAGGMTGRELSGGAIENKEVKVNNYDPSWAERDKELSWNPDGDDTSSGGGGYHDSTFDDVDDKINAEKFLSKWKQFTKDPALKKGTKNVTVADVFHETINNSAAAFPQMAQKFGIARNSVAALLQNAQEIMEKYNIAGKELMTAMQYFGNDKVASYLKDYATETVEQTAGKDEKGIKQEVKDSKSFIDKFEAAFQDDKFWKPHLKGTDAANVLLWWIEEDFPKYNKLADEYGQKLVDINWFMNRALKLLSKYGMSEKDLKDAVSKHGKRKVMNCIGDQS